MGKRTFLFWLSTCVFIGSAPAMGQEVPTRLPDGGRVKLDFLYLPIEPVSEESDSEGSDLVFSIIKRRKKGKEYREGPQVNSLFGIANHPTVIPLWPLYKELGVSPPATLRVLSWQYRFFLVIFGVHMVQARGEEFEEAALQVTYEGSSAYNLSLFPDTEWQTRVKLGFSAEVAVTRELAFSVLRIADTVIDPEATAIFNFAYEWRHPVVQAVGKQDSFCLWHLRKKKVLSGDLQLYVVIAVPHGVESMEVDMSAAFRIDTRWGLGGVHEYQSKGEATLLFYSDSGSVNAFNAQTLPTDYHQ